MLATYLTQKADRRAATICKAANKREAEAQMQAMRSARRDQREEASRLRSRSHDRSDPRCLVCQLQRYGRQGLISGDKGRWENDGLGMAECLSRVPQASRHVTARPSASDAQDRARKALEAEQESARGAGEVEGPQVKQSLGDNMKLKSILQVIVMTPVLWVVFIAAVILAPYAAYSSDDRLRLKPWLRWMETPDNLGRDVLYAEDAIYQMYLKHGPKYALMRWLMRNKAYRLRSDFGVPALKIDRNAVWADETLWQERRDSNRVAIHGLWGRLVTLTVDGRYYFDLRVGYNFNNFGLYVRSGWKLSPGLDGDLRPPFGTFQGIAPRTASVK